MPLLCLLHRLETLAAAQALLSSNDCRTSPVKPQPFLLFFAAKYDVHNPKPSYMCLQSVTDKDEAPERSGEAAATGTQEDAAAGQQHQEPSAHPHAKQPARAQPEAVANEVLAELRASSPLAPAPALLAGPSTSAASAAALSSASNSGQGFGSNFEALYSDYQTQLSGSTSGGASTVLAGAGLSNGSGVRSGSSWPMQEEDDVASKSAAFVLPPFPSPQLLPVAVAGLSPPASPRHHAQPDSAKLGDREDSWPGMTMGAVGGGKWLQQQQHAEPDQALAAAPWPSINLSNHSTAEAEASALLLRSVGEQGAPHSPRWGDPHHQDENSPSPDSPLSFADASPSRPPRRPKRGRGRTFFNSSRSISSAESSPHAPAAASSSFQAGNSVFGQHASHSFARSPRWAEQQSRGARVAQPASQLLPPSATAPIMGLGKAATVQAADLPSPATSGSGQTPLHQRRADATASWVNFGASAYGPRSSAAAASALLASPFASAPLAVTTADGNASFRPAPPATAATAGTQTPKSGPRKRTFSAPERGQPEYGQQQQLQQHAGRPGGSPARSGGAEQASAWGAAAAPGGSPHRWHATSPREGSGGGGGMPIHRCCPPVARAWAGSSPSAAAQLKPHNSALSALLCDLLISLSMLQTPGQCVAYR